MGNYLPPKKGRQAKPALRSKVMNSLFPKPFRCLKITLSTVWEDDENRPLFALSACSFFQILPEFGILRNISADGNTLINESFCESGHLLGIFIGSMIFDDAVFSFVGAFFIFFFVRAGNEFVQFLIVFSFKCFTVTAAAEKFSVFSSEMNERPSPL